MAIHPAVACLLLIDIVVPLLIARQCWKAARRTWWAHGLLAPLLVVFYGAAYLLTFYVLLIFSGRLEGLGLLLLPPMLSAIAIGSVYYLCVVVKLARLRVNAKLAGNR